MFERLTHRIASAFTFVSGRMAGWGIAAGLIAAGAIVPGAAFLVVAPLATALMVYLNRVDRNFDERQLMQDYRSEIAAKTGKPLKDVSVQDLRDVANGNPQKDIEANPVLGDALQRLHKRRDVSMWSALFAGAVAVAVGGLLLTTGLPALAIGAIVCGTHFAANAAADTIGSRKLRQTPSANDRIQELTRARGRVREHDIFDLYVEAHPKLSAQVRRSFGKAYAELAPEQQAEIYALSGAGDDVQRITQDFNRGLIRPQELAFAVAGQQSGIPKLEPVAPLGQRVGMRVRSVMGNFAQRLHKTPDMQAPDSLTQEPSFAERYAGDAALREKLMAKLRTVGGGGLETATKALDDYKVKVKGFRSQSENGEGGYYKAEDNTLYINLDRDTDRQVSVFVHEAQHACNLHGGLVLHKNEAVKRGLETYKQNFLWDEALAFATQFSFAQQAGMKKELDSPAMRELFSGFAYDKNDPDPTYHCAAYAMKQLEQGKLGYLDKAAESFEARRKELESAPAPQTSRLDPERFRPSASPAAVAGRA